ncbi:MAG: alpha/beta fold hydrolase [Allobranchiibius sp.]
MTSTSAGVRTQQQRWVQAPLDVTFSVLDAWADYATSAIGRGRVGPLDVLEDTLTWWKASQIRTQPTWSSQHTVVRSWPQAQLLDFSDLTGSAEGVPTLILPPQAGHASTIVDYSDAQSQVRTAQAAGLDRVFVLSWNSATQETSQSTIEDFIEILDATVAQLGGRVNLVGDCQGGWLAVIYAALRPEAVASLAVAGAPIDFKIGQSAIQEWVRSLSGRGELDFYQNLVTLGRGNHLGSNQILGFKMLEPAEEMVRNAALWGHIHDPVYVQRHEDFENWFDWSHDLPGAFYLWIVEHLFIRNELVKGELVVGDSVVDLCRITCPVFMLAGTTDHITPPAQMFALAGYVSTPESDIEQDLVEAGHLGLFMGRAALAGPWSRVFSAIAELDAVSAAAAADAQSGEA